jgi:octaprenyl-diphosphate synthase
MDTAEAKAIKRTLKKYPGLMELYGDIKGDLGEVEKTLQRFADSPNKIITEISEYLFQRSGKRMRPALLMICSRIFDYKGNEHVLLSALVETIHTASLIHDDIIDNSEIRRGQDSVHKRWGPNITVLLGDYLYIKTIALSLDTSSPEFIRILTDVSSQMIEGELHEYHMSGNLDLGEGDYLEIIRKKTASLFSASCRIGALLGEADADQERLFADYGMAIGMSFQIIDDLLDYSGDRKTLGKPILSDLSEGRITLPMIYALNQDDGVIRDRLVELFQAKAKTPEAKHEILDIVRSNGALDYTYHQAEKYSRRAQSLLSSVPGSMYRESLFNIPEYVLHRNR